jgi:DNA-binding phage protein
VAQEIERQTARAKILFRLQRVELGNLMMKSSKFDIEEYLDDQEMINKYLNTVLKEGDSNDIEVALGHIAKSIGMSKIAEQTGMSSKIQF